ncbi:chaperone of endosialidase [Kordia sp. SMS9]|uniref:tail fiber domain-containing protein n=1 Tax=Kordia sp. SMS9 TaxID=2282170 RepID=UPI000E0DD692|nr:tail fiber domain-containing protein [Kordia sp. SMS9]AXG69679.1 chaperone of endosialidase [Kordia sp. SMS9]
MKKFTLLLALFFVGILFAQNKSNGAVATSITSPTSTTGETFRFDSGLVTQLDAGSGFGFTSDRWFSMGRLFTGSQTVYGLRFQLPNKALTMGYQDINDLNPRLQWIGSGSSAATDFEFRVADSFTSTSSTLVATMTNDGKTYFGAPLTSNEPLVGIDYSNSSSSTKTGLIVQNNNTSGLYFTGIKAINNQSGYIKTGIEVQSDGSSYLSTGVSIRTSASYQNTGVSSRISGTSNGSSYAVRGDIPSTGTGFGAGIYGSSAILTNRYAGYFNGNVFTTGSYLPSDEKLKENVKTEENTLQKLAQLDAVTYTFKENEHLNLPSETQHGFLAQNLEEVFPELITTISKPIEDEKNFQIGTYEYKAVNYVGLISVLTASLKQLNEESAANIKELNEKVAALENQIEAMNIQASEEETQLGNLEEISGSGFSMEQNKPNPFTNQTVINYTLPSNTKATISVVDLSGKFIKDYNLSTEKGQLIINSSEIGRGIFVYALISNNEVMMTRKMIIR